MLFKLLEFKPSSDYLGIVALAMTTTAVIVCVGHPFGLHGEFTGSVGSLRSLLWLIGDILSISLLVSFGDIGFNYLCIRFELSMIHPLIALIMLSLALVGIFADIEKALLLPRFSSTIISAFLSDAVFIWQRVIDSDMREYAAQEKAEKIRLERIQCDVSFKYLPPRSPRPTADD